MEDLVRRRLGLGDSDLPASDIDRELNRIHRFELPTRCADTSAEGRVSYVTLIGQDTYNIDTLSDSNPTYPKVRAVSRPIFVSTLYPPAYELDYYTDPVSFWQEYDFIDTTQGRPSGVLVYGRDLIVRPYPDGIYALTVHALFYRASLTSAGITDDAEAYVIVDGAAMNLALDLGMDEVATRYASRFRDGIAYLAMKYSAHRRSAPALVMEF